MISFKIKSLILSLNSSYKQALSALIFANSGHSITTRFYCKPKAL
ncbi:uncharacterized protein METZ01_LOCUS119426 [marine metagenome]|uniref:Uncharacterized protein n=1 Tax=marine metagenome TaxID=408172 RepID=A0A381XQ05_9ZZZZ